MPFREFRGYVDTMTQLSGELEHTMANIPGIDVEPDGGTPDKPDKPNKPGEDDRIEQERRAAEELRKLRLEERAGGHRPDGGRSGQTPSSDKTRL